MKMKTTLTNLMYTALTAAVMAYAAHPSLAQEEYPTDPFEGKLIFRFMCDVLPEGASSKWQLMRDLPGLSRLARAIKIPQEKTLYIPIPDFANTVSLLDRPGHPYTFVLKFKIVSSFSGGNVVLVGMNGRDDMIYVDGTDRKLHVKAGFDPTQNEDYVSDDRIEENLWTTLAFAFGEDECAIWLNGNPFGGFGGDLAGSKADCSTSDGYIYIGGGSSFYLADIRMYDGPVQVADELLGMGIPEDPFLIYNARDWELLASNLRMGIKHGVPLVGNESPYYCLTNNIRWMLPVTPTPLEGTEDLGFSASESRTINIESPLGTPDNPFVGVFDGGSHYIVPDIGGSEYSEDSMAPFAYTGNVTISNLVVQGGVSSTVDYTAGLIGTCRGTTRIKNCDVQTSVSGAGHVGGIIGRIPTWAPVSLQQSVFSGSISNSTGHAGGLIGWCDSSYNNDLAVDDCLFAGSFRGTGTFHPILCKNTNISLRGDSHCGNTYYDNACTPTEDADHVDPRFPGTPVSRSYVADMWNQPVTAADGNVWYLKAPSVSYGDWAATNSIGAWNATDALGIPNVFRYVFNKPTGAIANPPLLSISFNTNGNPVIHTPPVVYDDGFTLSILATDDLNGTGPATFSLVPSGETEIPATTAPARFFRLKAAKQ